MRLLSTIGLVLVMAGPCALAQTQPATQPHPTAASSNTTKGKLRPFMGRVLLESSGYVLRAGDLEYKLGDSEAVKSYAGKNVKIMGTLDRPTNTIHVETIEPSI